MGGGVIDFLKSSSGEYLYPITKIESIYDTNGNTLQSILDNKQPLGDYALNNHNHDSIYSKLDHTHSNYLPLSGGTMNLNTGISWPLYCNKPILNFRPSNESITANLFYDGGGDECLFFNLKSDNTAFKIITGTDLNGFTIGSVTNSTEIPAFMVKAGSIYTKGNCYASSLVSNDGTISIQPYSSNEINFGGNYAGSEIYFGYRAIGSKPVPSLFTFGSGTGTAAIRFSGYFDGGVRGYGLAKQSNSPSNTDMVWAY